MNANANDRNDYNNNQSLAVRHSNLGGQRAFFDDFRLIVFTFWINRAEMNGMQNYLCIGKISNFGQIHTGEFGMVAIGVIKRINVSFLPSRFIHKYFSFIEFISRGRFLPK